MDIFRSVAPLFFFGWVNKKNWCLGRVWALGKPKVEMNDLGVLHGISFITLFDERIFPTGHSWILYGVIDFDGGKL